MSHDRHFRGMHPCGFVEQRLHALLHRIDEHLALFSRIGMEIGQMYFGAIVRATEDDPHLNIHAK